MSERQMPLAEFVTQCVCWLSQETIDRILAEFETAKNPPEWLEIFVAVLKTYGSDDETDDA